MHRLRRSLPSLTALIAFEAAARTGGFTRAADELGVTQAAVSRRIAALEKDIGLPLFERRNRAVHLTDAGRDLFASVRTALDGLADTVERMRAPGARLTITVSVAFAHFLLLPRLSTFREAHPDIDLRVISEDAWTAPDDRQIDLGVRYGTPPFRGMRVVGSLDETLVPVCTPALADRLGPLTLTDLAQRRDIIKIDSASPEPGWLNWTAWFRQSGWTGGFAEARLRFSSYSDAAYAAMNGEGVALGWTRLLQRPLADGRLTTLPLSPVVPEDRHFILVPEGKPPSPERDAFAAWLADA
ncbi:LysR substrate-binding domain-containing protein [Jannaschia pohangensis]|uniref:DNA-binding transcriptional regulator, LysR family n=1 Tax=Jannaschia pohangensis TaxID=390807 RepID=A0A1I3HBU1_9RHOB|nr:LysR substrate-binding domain-containing protein [Jannaschia pohangensis]SFI33099.1 DNA-binding transcriptional regulator, LysR family [Jannaschia pohangensis]